LLFGLFILFPRLSLSPFGGQLLDGRRLVCLDRSLELIVWDVNLQRGRLALLADAGLVRCFRP